MCLLCIKKPETLIRVVRVPKSLNISTRKWDYTLITAKISGWRGKKSRIMRRAKVNGFMFNCPMLTVKSLYCIYEVYLFECIDPFSNWLRFCKICPWHWTVRRLAGASNRTRTLPNRLRANCQATTYWSQHKKEWQRLLEMDWELCDWGIRRSHEDRILSGCLSILRFWANILRSLDWETCCPPIAKPYRGVG